MGESGLSATECQAALADAPVRSAISRFNAERLSFTPLRPEHLTYSSCVDSVQAATQSA